MSCCLCLLASLTFSVATDDLSHSAPGYVRQFIKLVFHLCTIEMWCICFRVSPSGEVQVYCRFGCCLNMVLSRANSCSKQKSSSCLLASFVSPMSYSPTADDIADGSLLPTFVLKSPITSSPLGGLFNCLSLGRDSPFLHPLAAVIGPIT